MPTREEVDRRAARFGSPPSVANPPSVYWSPHRQAEVQWPLSKELLDLLADATGGARIEAELGHLLGGVAGSGLRVGAGEVSVASEPLGDIAGLECSEAADPTLVENAGLSIKEGIGYKQLRGGAG